MKRAALAVALALAFLAPASAGHCSTWTTSTPDVTADASAVGGPAVYVADVVCTIMYCPGTPWSIWIYEESNGLPGLQRADEVVDDTCHGMIAGDTIVV